MIRRPPRSTRTDTLFPTRRSSDLQQIGIAADRRSEMRVVFVGQTKMADLLGTIDSLLQRSQTHGLDDFEVGPVARRLDQAGVIGGGWVVAAIQRSEEHTSELQSLMRISYAVFCLKKKKITRYILSLTDKLDR